MHIIGGDMPSGVVEKGTAIGAVANGYVSVTPLQLNMGVGMRGW
jgi:hypothetical protein